MAENWYDISAQTVGVAPTGWKNVWKQEGTLTVKEDAGLRKYIEFNVGVGADFPFRRRAFAWESGPSASVMEVYAEVVRETDPSTTDALVAYLVDIGAVTHESAEGYVAGWNNATSDTYRLSRYLSGNFSSLGTQTPKEPQTTSNLSIRAGRDASGVNRLRVWVTGDPEPSLWDIESTNTDIASGFAGIFMQTDESTLRVYGFGVGTNGDPAPTAPLGPATPANLGTTNVQATSARLTWEQG